jgi:hypothetical protein
MSILDALRVQQAENSSVRDLAMLPQAQIIKLAQMGQIPADVVPIIISEKARMSQQAAQMQASQSPTPPTVLEQAMAQNAQAEAPMNGVAAIPTQMFNEQNYATGGIVAFDEGGGVRASVRKNPSPGLDKEEQTLVLEYLKNLQDGRLLASLLKPEGSPTVAQLLAAKSLGAGEVSLGATGTPSDLQAVTAGYSRPLAGGQVGVNSLIPVRHPRMSQLNFSYAKRFSKGGLYSSPGEADIWSSSESEYVAPGPSVGSLDAYIREAAARRAEARKPSEAMLALERSMTDPSRFREARDEARNMALLQAGLGILGGSSQYALQNIGRGASGAVDAYGQQMRDIRKQEREALGQRAALDVRKQEQALADIAAGEASYSAARKEALEGRKIESAEERERIRAESAEERAELRNRGLIEAMQNRRDTDRAGFVADYVAGKREEGDKRSEAVLRLEGQQQFNNQQARFGLAEMQLQAQIIGQVNAEIARRRADPTSSDRAALRAWRASGKSEDEFWAGQKELALTSMYAQLAERTGAPARPTTAAPSQGTPRAATQLTRGAARVSDAPRLRYNPQTDELE